MAGTTSPAPFGPGTERTPLAYFLGACGPRKGLYLVVFGMLAEALAAPAAAPAIRAEPLKAFCAAMALVYAEISPLIAAVSEENT